MGEGLIRPQPKGGPVDNDGRAPVCPCRGKVGGKAQVAIAPADSFESRAIFDMESMFLKEKNIGLSSAQRCDAVVHTVSGFEASTVLREYQAWRLVRRHHWYRGGRVPLSVICSPTI